jgi:dTDP-4-amino-4,6-dideoxygalactose transaminase
MKKRIYLSSPHMSGHEIDFINEAFETNWIAPLGANIDGFEREVCEYTGAKYAVALSSGTAAIHMGLKYLGVGKDDYVFCSSLTFSASCNPIIYQGAKPIFIDSDYESWNMSPLALEMAFQKYPQPKAIVVVNLYGQSADYDKIRKIADNYGVPILEDAAESLGATYRGRQTGTFGDIGIYSFNGNKIITTSGGGMLVAVNPTATEKVKFWSTQSKENLPYYQHKEIGYNYRMSNIVAGIGRGQMSVLDERIAKKRYIYNFYRKAFHDIRAIDMMPIADYGRPNYWLSCLMLNDETSVRVQDIIQTLAARNIEARHIWKPLHKQPVFRSYDYFSSVDGEISCCDDIFNRGICLPSDTKMTDQDLEKVTGVIRDIFEYHIELGMANAL